MTDVSCKLTQGFLTFAAKYGVTGDALVPPPHARAPVSGRPYDAACLSDPEGRVPWPVFARFFRNWTAAMQAAAGEDWRALFAADTIASDSHQWMTSTKLVARTLTSPAQFYRLGSLFAGRQNMHNVSFGWTTLDQGRLRLELWVRQEDEPLPEFFQLVAVVMRYVPRALGLPLAIVNPTQLEGRRGVYEITPPPYETLWARAKRALRARTATPAILERLLKQEVALEQRVHEVQQARSELEAKVRERTAELAAAERKYRELVEASAHLIWSTDRNARLTFINATSRQIFGHDPAHLRGRRLAELAGCGRGALFGLARRLLREGRLEHEGRAAGSEVVLRTSCVLMRDELGRAAGATGTSIDVTEERRLSERVTRSQSMLSRAQSLAGVGSWEWTLATGELTWSDETYRIFGYEPGSITPTVELVLSHFDPDGSRGLREQIGALKAETEPVVVEHVLVQRDGTRRIVREQREVLRDEAGEPTRVTGALEDITLRKEHEAGLVRAKEEADAASATKSAFLANMSHEIRTPLTAVLGYAELLANTSLPPQQRQRCLETISRNGRHLMELIDDLLDLSKIEAGHLKVARLPIAPAVEIQSALAFLREQAEAKGLTFELSFTERLPPVVEMDPTRLRQITINLVGNAVKFTDRGRIDVEVDREGEELCLRVKDTGCGISEEGRRQLFEPFSQIGVGAVIERRSGTGLGLALARRLAHALGGDVTLESSREGAGSTFAVRLPAPMPTGFSVTASPATVVRGDGVAAGVAAAIGALRGMRILVVDDDADMRLILVAMLQDAGAMVETLPNGEEVARCVAQRPFDLVVLDLNMPVVNGFQALSAIRRQGFQRPVVALTASAMPEDMSRCYDAGCDDVVSKPFQAAALIASLAKWTRPESGMGGPR